MNEFDLIATWFGELGAERVDVCLGVGDDAALIALDDDQELITTSACTIAADMAIPEQTASRCFDEALQALLKQQATPAWAVLCLCLAQIDPGWLDRFAVSLNTSLRRHQVQLIGGDTTHGPTLVTLFLSGYRSKSAV